MCRSDPLPAAMRLLRPRLPRLLLALTLGAASLASALALAGVSAWLITRAWQMPPVLDLTIAVVTVRALAISRGVLHYCERLAAHDTALRGAGAARAQVYHRLAHGPADAAVRLHSGELLARVGTDVDELANVLVRALLPIGVAAVLALAATAVIAAISPRAHHSARDVAAMIALEHAPELRVAGTLPAILAESRRRHDDWGVAVDTAARPAAIAEAMTTAAIGVSVLGARWHPPPWRC